MYLSLSFWYKNVFYSPHPPTPAKNEAFSADPPTNSHKMNTCLHLPLVVISLSLTQGILDVSLMPERHILRQKSKMFSEKQIFSENLTRTLSCVSVWWDKKRYGQTNQQTNGQGVSWSRIYFSARECICCKLQKGNTNTFSLGCLVVLL